MANYTLKKLKDKKTREINKHSDELLNEGMEYSNLMFDMSLEDQKNYLSLYSFKDIFDYTNDPPKVHCRNLEGNRTDIVFNTQQDLVNFVLAGLGFVKNLIDSGNDLKLQVDNATTVEELNNIVDDRS